MDKKAILFDFDGVVVKSMEQHFEAWKKAFAEWGVEMKAEDFFILEGQGVKTIAYQIGDKYGLSRETVDAVMERKINYYNQFMRLEFYDHFFELIERLQKNKIPLGIVTGGNRDRVLKVVDEYFKNVFRAIVTVEDVERGKPHPDPFLKGAELLNMEPQHCVVIENAPMGIRGAKRAGMTVIGITTTLNETVLHEANYIAHDFFEVEKILQKLFNLT